ncbi:MAG TPA: hypothetical protein VLQ91_12245 [Draconibacterium sp.]|nr:hypothetical protein [Draconibacterium sp.]
MKIKLLISFFIILMIVLFTGSCNKDNLTDEPENKPDDSVKDKIALLDETNGKIEKALNAGDSQTFLAFVSPAYEKYYKDAVQKNASKLVQFADVFKTRRLLTCDGFYAVYEVQYNGKKFEISMILDDDGKWKLKDL